VVTVRAATSTTTPASLAVLMSSMVAVLFPPPRQASFRMVCAKPLTTLT
jgi:hypothetical protein